MRIKEIPDGEYLAEDMLDDDGISNEPVFACGLRSKAKATVDFNGSAPQVAGPINAVAAITVSAVSMSSVVCLKEICRQRGLDGTDNSGGAAGTVVNAVHPPQPWVECRDVATHS